MCVLGEWSVCVSWAVGQICLTQSLGQVCVCPAVCSGVCVSVLPVILLMFESH